MKVYAKAGSLSGELSVPGSKSHTIRACILASFAEGTSQVVNPLPSEDCLAALPALSLFGVKSEVSEGVWTVHGAGVSMHLPDDVINVCNSGSLLYFLFGVAAGFEGTTVITGDSSIRTRPIDEALAGIRQLGADGYTTRPGVDAPPVVIRGAIRPGHTLMNGRLSQPVSGLMMSAARLDGTFEIELERPCEKPFLKMTTDWLEWAGVPVEYDRQDFRRFTIRGPHAFKPFTRAIPSDWEGVAFPLVAALLTDSELTIANIDLSGSQGDAAIVDVLRAMGADIEIDESNSLLIARGGSKSRTGGTLRGITVNCGDFPDAVPILSVAACFAEGETRLTDIGVCRIKETDRISVMRNELSKLGADVEEGADFLGIRGGSTFGGGSRLHGGEVESHHDHRVAMALSVFGLALPSGEVIVNGAECCSVSFPGFYDILNRCGAAFTFAK